MRVRAHAKINVSLRVLGRRPDGYHELRTVFQSIALHDTIFVASRPGPLEVTSTDPSLPSGPDNLVWRAADLFWRTARRRGTPSALHIHIVKHIPPGGGLGGGSSDAAAVIRALAALWGLPGGPDALEAVASQLGADVPYFLYGGAALGLDRGDRVFPLTDLPACWVVLALPSFAVSTAAAFAWFDRGTDGGPAGAGRLPNLNGPAGEVINDLEGAVAARHPEIRRLRRALLRAGAFAAAMTGTGSTVFGLFGGESAARRAATTVGGRVPTLVTRFLHQGGYRRSSAVVEARSLPPRARIG